MDSSGPNFAAVFSVFHRADTERARRLDYYYRRGFNQRFFAQSRDPAYRERNRERSRVYRENRRLIREYGMFLPEECLFMTIAEQADYIRRQTTA